MPPLMNSVSHHEAVVHPTTWPIRAMKICAENARCVLTSKMGAGSGFILDSGSSSVPFTTANAMRSLTCEQHLGEGCSGEASHDSNGLGRFVLYFVNAGPQAMRSSNGEAGEFVDGKKESGEVQETVVDQERG